MDQLEEKITLLEFYHGTTDESAAALIRNGWSPSSGMSGANCGDIRYLYITTHYEDALWFSEQKGSSTVLVITGLDLNDVIVDPEDGIGESVAEEIYNANGLPGKLAIRNQIPASKFSIYQHPGHNFQP